MAAPVTGWIDSGTHLRVWIDIPLRKNGLPNLAAARVAQNLLESVNPDAYDPIEGVPEDVARAALRDRETITLSENTPPVPVFDDDEFPGYRCANGTCHGD
ncbi:hypothetical protein [Noviluteimonas gilva]|uniref:Uncharacterized protein n=1 Tax=Noviluteimonas gilva TaxID=2682097 RepID=A0A7C9LLY1_9GAMM|nr:hypothetical protein [Lysobacter gilvus]MUV13563.1 hypothetical protein [Lysobacter gilvus]